MTRVTIDCVETIIDGHPVILCNSPSPVEGSHTEIGYDDKCLDKLIHKYEVVFHRHGKLNSKQIDLQIDSTFCPIAEREQRSPLHLRAKVEEDLQCVENSRKCKH